MGDENACSSNQNSKFNGISKQTRQLIKISQHGFFLEKGVKKVVSDPAENQPETNVISKPM